MSSGGSPLTKPKWHKTKNAAEHSEVLLAVLQVAASSFGLAGCIGARIGHGVATLESTLEYSESFIWWWKRGCVNESYTFYPEHRDRLKLSSIFGREAWPNCSSSSS